MTGYSCHWMVFGTGWFCCEKWNLRLGFWLVAQSLHCSPLCSFLGFFSSTFVIKSPIFFILSSIISITTLALLFVFVQKSSSSSRPCLGNVQCSVFLNMEFHHIHALGRSSRSLRAQSIKVRLFEKRQLALAHIARENLLLSFCFQLISGG